MKGFNLLKYISIKDKLVELTDGLLWGVGGQDLDSRYVQGPSSSVASEVALFDGTTGKIIKRATGTGIVKATSGVYSAGAATDDLTDVATTSAAEGDRHVHDGSTFVNLPFGTLRKGRVAELIEEFGGGTAVTGNVGDHNWYFLLGGGGAISAGGATLSQPGQYFLNTSATGGSSVLVHNSGWATAHDSIDEVEFIFYVNQITNVQYVVGLTDTTGMASRVIAIIFDTVSATVTWHTYKDTVAGAAVIGTLGVTVTSATVYHVLFKRSGSGSWDITVTDNANHTATANVTGLETAANYFPAFRISNMAAEAKGTYLDYCRMVIEPITRVT